MRIFSGTARSSSYFDADSKLQELVEAEFDVLLKNMTNGERAQKPAATRTLKEDSDAKERPLPESLTLPFSPEEESFIASSIAFLRGRPNADLLLEELWSATVSAQAPEGETEGAAEDSPVTQGKVAPRETPDGGNPGGPDNV